MLYEQILHVLAIFLLPPLLQGVINRTKAWWAGRRGAPFLQPYYDLWRLVHKGSVFSETTTWVFRAGPVINFAAITLAALMVPLVGDDTPLSFTGDLILFAYALGLARFFTVAAALDTGSPFEGMGGAREATFACLAEPVLFFGLLVLVRMTGKLSLSELLGGPFSQTWGNGGAALLMVVVSWFLLLLAENCRIPVDDPNTHLELTMIHEVMVLDHSGPAFGLILYAAAMKLLVFSTLVVRLIVPLHNDTVPAGWDPIPWTILNWVAYLVAILGLATLVGTVESVMGRVRMQLIPNWLIGAGVLAAFSLVLVLVR